MSRFRTPIDPSKSLSILDYEKKILSLGSCFSVEVGTKLESSKFDVVQNPLGIAFNPIGILNQLNSFKEMSLFDSLFVEHDEQFFNLLAHSEFRSSDLQSLKSILREQQGVLADSFSAADVVLITWGSAFAYRHQSSQCVVANCHKQDSKLFAKDLVDPKTIIESYSKLFEESSKKKFVIAVSPVRHIKDTLELNSVSKSVLRLAAHHLSEDFDNVHYFPSFEVLMDDLRDYRFYKSDMLHPSEDAVQYIWEFFQSRFMSQQCLSILKRWHKVYKALQHRPFNVSGPGHQDFLKSLLDKLFALPLDTSVEEELLRKKIKNS